MQEINIALDPTVLEHAYEDATGEWAKRVSPEVEGNGKWMKKRIDFALDTASGTMASYASSTEVFVEMLRAFDSIVFAKARKAARGNGVRGLFFNVTPMEVAHSRINEFGSTDIVVKSKMRSIIRAEAS